MDGWKAGRKGEKVKGWKDDGWMERYKDVMKEERMVGWKDG